MAQHKATLRRSLRSALKHKRAADQILDGIKQSQDALNSALDKLDADGASAVAATATWDLTTDIVLTSVVPGAARNTNTVTLEVEAAAANPTDTILADVTGTAAAIVITITPNDGTNNGATPVDLTTAELVELINTGSVTGKTVTLTDASTLIDDQTATGGDATVLADSGEGDGEVATFGGGVAADTLDTDYASTLAISSPFEADTVGTSAQHKASLRRVLRSSLSHKKLADEIADSMEEIDVAFNAWMTKLDAESGTLNDTDYASTLGLTVIDSDATGTEAQHKASFRRSMRSAVSHKRLADQIMDAISGMQTAMNSSLAALDSGSLNGAHAGFKVTPIDPDSL